MLSPIIRYFDKVYTLAHSWYPLKCCSDKDCHPVKCTSIAEKADGHWVHDTGAGLVTFTHDQVYPSMDALCHACYNNAGEFFSAYCLFIQINS